MNDKIEHIVLNKRYIDLSTEELLYLQDWADNEEEFDRLKRILSASNKRVAPPLSQKTKERLDDLFYATYKEKNGRVVELRNWYLSLTAIAAILVVGWWLWPDFSETVEVKHAKDEISQPKSKVQKAPSLSDHSLQEPLSATIKENEQSEPLALELPLQGNELPAAFHNLADDNDFRKHPDFLEERMEYAGSPSPSSGKLSEVVNVLDYLYTAY